MKPTHQATPWINNVVLAESKDKLGKLKLRIYLDTTNLNKVIIYEPYHSKTLKILHICLQMHMLLQWEIAEKGIGISSLRELHHS